MNKENIYELSLPYPNLPNRKARVYVPEHEENETFPVIYMTDGQNLFEEETTPFGSWLTREAVKAERKISGKGAIIVGIHNDLSPMQRTNELTPKSIGDLFIPDYIPNEIRKSISCEGEVFDDFVLNVVKPEVEKRFPVKKGRENTAFCGSSSGGLMAFYTALKNPEVFCAAGAFSPCFMIYKQDDLIKWIHSMIKENMPYLYIYTGGADELEREIFESVEFTYDILLECYPPEKLSEVVLLENKHNEASWREIFKDFLHTFLTRRSEF